MNSMIYFYAAIKREQEQNRVIRKQRPKHRVLPGGCVLYQLTNSKAGDQWIVQS